MVTNCFDASVLIFRKVRNDYFIELNPKAIKAQRIHTSNLYPASESPVFRRKERNSVTVCIFRIEMIVSLQSSWPQHSNTHNIVYCWSHDKGSFWCLRRSRHVIELWDLLLFVVLGQTTVINRLTNGCNLGIIEDWQFVSIRREIRNKAGESIIRTDSTCSS